MQVTRSWTAYSSFNIVDLVFSLWSHFLLFMSAVSCRINFHYFVNFVGCPCMISNHDFHFCNSNQSTFHLRALIHSTFNSYWTKYMQKVDHHVPRVVNVIVRSHSWLHQANQANGLLKRNPILSAQVHGCSWTWFVPFAEYITQCLAIGHMSQTGPKKVFHTPKLWKIHQFWLNRA